MNVEHAIWLNVEKSTTCRSWWLETRIWTCILRWKFHLEGLVQHHLERDIIIATQMQAESPPKGISEDLYDLASRWTMHHKNSFPLLAYMGGSHHSGVMQWVSRGPDGNICASHQPQWVRHSDWKDAQIKPSGPRRSHNMTIVFHGCPFPLVKKQEISTEFNILHFDF